MLSGWSDFRDHAVSKHMLNIRHIKVPDPHFFLGVKQNLYLALKLKLLDPLKNSSLVIGIAQLRNLAHPSPLSANVEPAAQLILYQVGTNSRRR
jgi:hypothetical protein